MREVQPSGGVVCPLHGCGSLPCTASLHVHLASAEFLPLVVVSYLQFPGWSQGPEGSLIIALGNEDALGEYSCSPYNSVGTAGPSPVTRVLLKVRLRVGQQWQRIWWLKVGARGPTPWLMEAGGPTQRGEG